MQSPDPFVEELARAMVLPLGYTQQAADNWDGVWVGNQMDDAETGSLKYLCMTLSRAAQPIIDARVAQAVEEAAKVCDGLGTEWATRAASYRAAGNNGPYLGDMSDAASCAAAIRKFNGGDRG